MLLTAGVQRHAGVAIPRQTGVRNAGVVTIVCVLCSSPQILGGKRKTNTTPPHPIKKRRTLSVCSAIRGRARALSTSRLGPPSPRLPSTITDRRYSSCRAARPTDRDAHSRQGEGRGKGPDRGTSRTNGPAAPGVTVAAFWIGPGCHVGAGTSSPTTASESYRTGRRRTPLAAAAAPPKEQRRWGLDFLSPGAEVE